MDLQKELIAIIRGNVTDKIAESTGVTPDQVTQVIAAGLPVILGQMANNAVDEHGADTLDTAVAKDHTGGPLLESLGSLFNQAGSNVEGAKILDHVFSIDKDALAQNISKKTGLSAETVMGVLTFVTPLIMAQLGKMRQNDSLDAGQIADVLKEQKDNEGNPLMDMVAQVLDKNKDGNIIDDVVGMFANKKPHN